MQSEQRQLALRDWSTKHNAIYIDAMDEIFTSTFKLQKAIDFPNRNIVFEGHVEDAWLSDGKGYILAEPYLLELEYILIECTEKELSDLCNSEDCMYAHIACLVAPKKIQLKPAYLAEPSDFETCSVISDGFSRVLSVQLLDVFNMEVMTP